MMIEQGLIRHLLRIITPEEVNDLTTVGDMGAKDSLTDLLLGHNRGQEVSYTAGGMAKILPFPGQEEEVSNLGINDLTDGDICTGERVHQFINNFITRVRFEVHPGATPVETTTFIINEKEKFKNVYTKIKGKEVLDLYAKNSVVDLSQERKNRRDLSQNSSTGVLVNKKHY